LFTYEIKKTRTSPPEHHEKHTKSTFSKDQKQELLDRHWIRFWGQVGDLVVFKRPKKPKQLWKVVEIATEVEEIHWTNDGWIPNYIKLEGEVKQRDGTTKLITCWTCENKLKPIGVANGQKASARGKK
jgi:hypothetical protein